MFYESVSICLWEIPHLLVHHVVASEIWLDTLLLIPKLCFHEKDVDEITENTECVEQKMNNIEHAVAPSGVMKGTGRTGPSASLYD